MGYVEKVYGEADLYNLRKTADPNPVSPSDIRIINHGPTFIETSVITSDGSFRMELTGNFLFSEDGEAFADASGEIFTFTVYKNDQLHRYESYGRPVDAAVRINADFDTKQSWLNGDDLFVGSATADMSDEIQGLAGNDTFIGYASGQWGDKFFGGDGIDTAVLQGSHSEYNIKFIDYMLDGRTEAGGRVEGYEITDNTPGRDGIDYLNNVERLKFSDTNLALDIGKGEIAGSAYRIYKAAFDRVPDAGGLGFWINAMDDGASLTSVAAGFINSPEFKQLYGANVTDRDFVTKVYTNVLDRNPDQSGYDFWLGAMGRGATRADILASFSESPENIGNVADLIANGIQYQEWI